MNNDHDPDDGSLDIPLPFWTLVTTDENNAPNGFSLWKEKDTESISVFVFTERLFAERYLTAYPKPHIDIFEVSSSAWFGDRLTDLLNSGVRHVAVDAPYQPGQQCWKIPIPEFIDAMPPDPH